LNTADLCDNVWAFCKFRDGGFPFCENFVPLACIWSDTDWSAKMIEYDRRIREGPCQIRQFRNLRVVDPTFECQSIIFKMCVGSAEIGIQQKMLHDGGAVW